jgi:hypothetical protein
LQLPGSIMEAKIYNFLLQQVKGKKHDDWLLRKFMNCNVILKNTRVGYV